MDKFEFTAMFEVNQTFGSGAIAIFRQRRMIGPLSPTLIRVKIVSLKLIRVDL